LKSRQSIGTKITLPFIIWQRNVGEAEGLSHKNSSVPYRSHFGTRIACGNLQNVFDLYWQENKNETVVKGIKKQTILQ
jgi:hypothetical protein